MTNDEELAIETLKRRKACMENSPTIEPHYLSDLPDEIIKSLQTVAIDVSDGFVVFERKRPQGEWTPVSEGLPKQANKSYLVTVDYGDGLICSCQRFFFGEGIGWNDDSVIAWQPLPEPYMKDEEK